MLNYIIGLKTNMVCATIFSRYKLYRYIFDINTYKHSSFEILTVIVMARRAIPQMSNSYRTFYLDFKISLF